MSIILMLRQVGFVYQNMCAVNSCLIFCLDALYFVLDSAGQCCVSVITCDTLVNLPCTAAKSY
eukprot:1157703-Pelagomonas_calceolata.AAC.5